MSCKVRDIYCEMNFTDLAVSMLKSEHHVQLGPKAQFFPTVYGTSKVCWTFFKFLCDNKRTLLIFP